MPPKQRYLISRNSSMPYREPSRPRPDCLTPPNGVTSVESVPVLMPTMLEAFFSALREGCTPTPGPERLGDPPPCHRRHQKLARKTAGESLRDHCGVALTGAFKVTDVTSISGRLGSSYAVSPVPACYLVQIRPHRSLITLTGIDALRRKLHNAGPLWERDFAYCVLSSC